MKDEPTAVLTPQEVEGFFQILRQLKEIGKTIIIITHKLKETIEITDSLTILRKGKLILTRKTEGADERVRGPNAGKIELDGKEITKKDTAQYLQYGIAHIPEERGVRGGVADFTLWENYILGYHHRKRYQRKGILRVSEIRKQSQSAIEEFGIRCDSIENTISELSGGNQQKLIIARAFSHNPKVIIAAQPTRGVDIGAMFQGAFGGRNNWAATLGTATPLIFAGLEMAISSRAGVLTLAEKDRLL